jgi:S1-C subfamily serine protease
MQVTKGRVKAMMTVVGKTVEAGGVAYGGPPDLGILSTVFQGQTPYLKITERELLPEGAEVYFCGFPLGEEMFMGKHGQEQVTSTLQRGIIGAHLPFAGIAHPHGFVIDATSNGGNSGSAVIDPDTSEVIGVVFAKRTEAFTYAVCARGFGKITGYIDELESSGSAKKVITVPW